MVAEQISERTYSEEEYLELELESESKHELVNGKRIEMPGESLIASEVAGNLHFALKAALRGQPFKVYQNDVKLRTAEHKKYRYPDVMVRSTQGQADTHTVYQAILTAEVTSENSTGVDHDDKLREYTALPSLQCYLIIDQTEPLVEVYQRTDAIWIYTFFTDLSASFTVSSLGVTLSLQTIYEGVY